MESNRLLNSTPVLPSPSVVGGGSAWGNTGQNNWGTSNMGTMGHAPQSFSYPAQGSSAPISAPQPVAYDEFTLDESVWTTVWRDIKAIGRNLMCVLIPINWKFLRTEGSLRNWDLWGPLIFMLLLAITLSWGEDNPAQLFAMVFTEVGLGAVILTLNVILLGGDIVFFQALCLLGYCLFPIDVAAIICAGTTNKIIRSIALLIGLGWASWATVPFMGNAVPQTRRFLSVYPVLLLYSSIGWIALVKRG